MDQFWGYATEIVDGDTFVMEVTRVGRYNRYEYNNEERVRVKGLDAPELRQRGGRQSRRRLRLRLNSNRLRVYVHARDCYRRIIGSVEVE